MKRTQSSELSVMYLSWVNAELRREAQQRAAAAEQSRTLSRLKAYAVAGLSGIALAALRLFDL
jgi:hypothetical protein